MKSSIPIYRYPEIQQAIANNQPIFWVEGEKVADALWSIGIAATTSIGGSNGYTHWGTYKNDLKDANLVICPDRDEVGMKYAEQVFSDFPDAKWLYAFPKSPLWNIPLPRSGGLDIADWIEDGATPQQILMSAESKRDVQTKSRSESKKEKRESKMNKVFAYIEQELGESLRLNLLTGKMELDSVEWSTQSYRLNITFACDLDLSEADAFAISSAIALKNAYHPIQDWLDELSEMYGTSTINLLDTPSTLLLKTTNPLYDLYLRNQMIAAVARIYDPGCKVDFATLLQGKQSIGKSTFWRNLAGEAWFDDTVNSNLDDKDELAKLHECWFEELQEFDRITNKKEAALVKSYLSTQVDRYRAPYDRYLDSHPRRMVLVGSVNPSEFLVDETGNRRFQIIPVTDYINTDLVTELRPRLWAAAVALYKKGVKWHLTIEQEKVATEQNKAFEIQDLWAATVNEYLSEDSNLYEKSGEVYVMQSKILEHLGIEIGRQTQFDKRRLSKVLTQLGWSSLPNSIKLPGFKNSVRVWSRNGEESNSVTASVTPNRDLSNPYSVRLLDNSHSSHGKNAETAATLLEGVHDDRDRVAEFSEKPRDFRDQAETLSQQGFEKSRNGHGTQNHSVTSQLRDQISTKESRFQPLAVGSVVHYAGNKYSIPSEKHLTITEIDGIYVMTVTDEGDYSTWLPISDVKKGIQAKGKVKNNA